MKQNHAHQSSLYDSFFKRRTMVAAESRRLSISQRIFIKIAPNKCKDEEEHRRCIESSPKPTKRLRQFVFRRRGPGLHPREQPTQPSLEGHRLQRLLYHPVETRFQKRNRQCAKKRFSSSCERLTSQLIFEDHVGTAESAPFKKW